MSIEPSGFLVRVEEFARSHYIKQFQKRPAWSITWKGLEQILVRFDATALAGKLEPPIAISEDRSLILYKMSFRMADENKSAKASGNRLIFVCDFPNRIIRVLLVYNKNHVEGPRETDWWKGLVYDQYDNLP